MQRTCLFGSPGLPVGLLVDDRVQADGGLAGLPVADDQLALAAADRRHGVDGLDAGGHGLLHRLALDDRGGLELKGATRRGLDRATAVDRRAQRVDHATQVAVADGHRQHLAGALDALALLDQRTVAEEHDADLTDVEVQRQAQQAALELEQLVGHRRMQPLDPCDPVAGLDHAADLFACGLRRERRDVALDRCADLVGTDRQLRHRLSSFHPRRLAGHVVVVIRRSADQRPAGLLDAGRHGRVDDLAADAHRDPPDHVRVHRHIQSHVATMDP